jgi:virginiamycin A acetyltransferase
MSATTVLSPSRGGVLALKRLLNLLALALVSPCALVCWLELKLTPASQGVFATFVHAFAMLPGPCGVFLRRAFYRWTLEACAEDVTVSFGVLFARRNVRMDRGAYVGPYALIGSAWLQEGVLIGSRASLLSGGRQHELLPSGEWSPTDPRNLSRIVIGRNTWVGEGAILMADTGACCMVAAGSVVSSPVPAGVMVGGNPARFIRRLVAEESATEQPPGGNGHEGTAPFVTRLA